MIDPTCDSCQRTKLSQSFNPCTSQGRSICSCDCHNKKQMPDNMTIENGENMTEVSNEAMEKARAKFLESNYDPLDEQYCSHRSGLELGFTAGYQAHKDEAQPENNLPCPICNGIEGCDHTRPERARAAQQPEVDGLKDDKKLLEFAVQQFTGFHEAVRGRNCVIDLVKSMGLKKSEFKKIRKDLEFMHHDELAELDEHFRA